MKGYTMAEWNMRKDRKKGIAVFFMAVIVVVSLIIAISFGIQKKGFHEDEYYSYYSTCFSEGWTVPDGEWVDMEHYAKEFMVLDGEKFQYSLVKTIQSWDVHPPMYYWMLHTVCSLSPNQFSKWQGILVNLIAYAISIVLFFLCASEVWQREQNRWLLLVATAVFAWTPGMISGVMFIRMYMVLTLEMLLSLYLHLRAWNQNSLTKPVYLICMFAITYAGFLTHYYHMVFQFFLTFAVCMMLFWKDRNPKRMLIYGGTILLGIVMGIFSYPSSLGQMFHGQRGAEATDNFFDMQNTFDRLLYFVKLANKFWYGRLLLLLVLVLAICFIFRIREHQWCQWQMRVILWLTVLGYFFAVSKTALMLGDSSVRYILPIFGPSMLAILATMAIGETNSGVVRQSARAFAVALGVLCFTVICGNMISTFQGNILFLYPEDEEKIAFAREHASDAVVYIFQGNDSWKVWESTDELLEYEQVYFVSDDLGDMIKDVALEFADEVIVYVHGNAEKESQLSRLPCYAEANCEYVREEKFCSVYIIKK